MIKKISIILYVIFALLISFNDIYAGDPKAVRIREINSATTTAGNVWVANGNTFDSVAISGDCTLSASGSLNCPGAVVDELTDLNDVNSATLTAANILVSDGAGFNSVAVGGDCTILSTGVMSCSSSGSSQLTDLADVNSATVTPGNVLLADGSGYNAATFSGDATITAAGLVEVTEADALESDPSNCASGSGAGGITAAGAAEDCTDYIQQSELLDEDTMTSNSATKPSSQQSIKAYVDTQDAAQDECSEITNCTPSAITASSSDTLTNKTIDADNNTLVLDLTDLSDVNSSTAAKGTILVSDAAAWNAIPIGSDTQVLTADSTQPMGLSWQASSGGATQLTGLSDVNTSTATFGNLLSANGTNWNSTLEVQIKSGNLYLTNYDCTGNGNGGALTTESDGKVICSDDDGGAGSGDNVTVNSTAVDTTANFLDGDIDFTHVDGGAGGPDSITATVECDGCVSVNDIADLNSATSTYGNVFFGTGGDGFIPRLIVENDISDLTHTADEVGTLTTGDLCINDGSSVNCTVNTEAELETALDGTDVFTSSDGALNDDDLSNNVSNDLSDVNTATHSSGGIIYSDGTQFHILTVGANDEVLVPDSAVNGGLKWTTNAAGATQLSGLADVNSSTSTFGNILMGTGGDGFISRQAVIGDLGSSTSASLAGVISNETGSGVLVFGTSPTLTTPLLSGKFAWNGDSVDDDDCTGDQGLAWYDTIDSAFEFCNANSGTPDIIAGGATQLTGLDDVNSATVTRGSLLVADNATWNSIGIGSDTQVLTADSTQPFGLSWAAATGGATQLTGLGDVNSATTTSGNLFVADGSQWHSYNSTKIDWGTGDLSIGNGTDGAVDFGVNTITDDIAGNLLKDYIQLTAKDASLSGTFITLGATLVNDRELDFSGGGTDEALWGFRMPNTFRRNLVAKIPYSMSAGCSSTKVDIEIKIMAVTDGDAQDINSDSFATLNEVTGGTSCPATAGYPDEISLSIVNDDSVQAGDWVWVHVQRDHDDADDTETTAEMTIGEIQLEWER